MTLGPNNNVIAWRHFPHMHSHGGNTLRASPANDQIYDTTLKQYKACFVCWGTNMEKKWNKKKCQQGKASAVS